MFCYSQHLRGLIRTRIQQLVSECIELRLSSTRTEPGRFKAVRVAGQTGAVLRAPECVGAKVGERGGVLRCDLQQQAARPVYQGGNRSGASAAGGGWLRQRGIIQFFFEDTSDDKGFNIYILDESNRVEVYHHCEGSKEELVRDVSRFYSSSHDRFTYGSSFINFNLPQFYQIVQLDGRTQVIPFRSNVLSSLCVTVADGAAQPLKQQFQLH